MVVCSITTKIHHTGVATCTLMLAIVLGMNYKHTPHGFIDFLNFSGIAGWQSWLGWLAWLSWLGWMGCRWAGWAFRAGWLRWLGRLGWLGWLGWARLGSANSRNNVRLIRWDVRSKNNTLGLQPQQPVAQPLKRIPYLSRCIGSSGNAWGPRSSPGEQRLVKGAAVSTEMKGDLANQPSPLRNESRTGLDPAALPWCLAIVVAC